MQPWPRSSLCLSVNLALLGERRPRSAPVGTVRRQITPLKDGVPTKFADGCSAPGLAEDESIPSLGLAQVVGTFDCGHLPPTEVANLAEILRVWPSNLGEPYRWRAEMASLSLRSRAGTWVPAKALIRGTWARRPTPEQIRAGQGGSTPRLRR